MSSQIKVNTINDASGGNNAVLYGPACPNNSMGFRNRIINGDMRIDQRNAGASVTPANGAYTIDRFMATLTQTSKFSVQQNAGAVTPPTGFKNYLGVTSLSAYSVVASDTFTMRHSIEGFNVADLAWGTASAQAVTMSFWVRSSLTGTFGGSLSNAAVNRCYVFSYTINSANTWEYKTITISGDTTGTWATDNTIGIRIDFSLGAGSTYTAAAGSWGATYYNNPTGGQSVVGTNGATFYITGVQLEAGTVASPFERRDYGRELQMCQRYYEVSQIDKASASGCYTLIAYATTETNGIRFAVTKRANPTVTLFNTSGVSGVIGGNNNAATAGYIGTNGFGYVARTGNTVGAGYYAHFSASSEL